MHVRSHKRVGVGMGVWHRAGGIIVTPLPGATPTKPGSATFPFFGIKIELKDREGKLLEGNNVSGVVCVSTIWPSIARTIYGDHERYLATYMKPFPGCYFTGDGAIRDKDGYLWITGRVDGTRTCCCRVPPIRVSCPLCFTHPSPSAPPRHVQMCSMCQDIASAVPRLSLHSWRITRCLRLPS